MYLGQAGDYSQAEIDNWIAWQGAQPADAFLMGTAKTVADYWKANGFTQAGLEELARNALAQGDFRAQYFPASEATPWEDPNWPAKTAAAAAAREAERIRVANTPSPFTIGPGPNVSPGTATRPVTTTPAAAVPATREQVVNAFRMTPGANPQPDENAITYYMAKGVAQLVIDVAAIRKANPALAAQIDAQRRSMGLPTAGGAIPPVMPITPVTTPTIGTGGITTLLLAAAAAYLIGS